MWTYSISQTSAEKSPKNGGVRKGNSRPTNGHNRAIHTRNNKLIAVLFRVRGQFIRNKLRGTKDNQK